MLIIDDDADIRAFLSSEFADNFVILTASNGNSGLEAARNNDVNIIICDVMMPDMSGFDVTRLLKEDFATSHIPIIQLTALNNDDCKIEGITSGADAYVTKPFNLKFLKTRVAKLIEQRENLFAKFSANPTMARPQLPMGDKDKEFAVAEEYREKLRTKCPTVEQNVGNLSGGNQQKVLLAKWMFADPDVLILDEPTRGIDVGAKYEIYCIINELAAAGKSVIMISSEMAELLGMCDKILVMCEGENMGVFDRSEFDQVRLMAAATGTKKEDIRA